MKREFLDYVEDIIGAMEDALSFVEGMDYDDFGLWLLKKGNSESIVMRTGLADRETET